MDEYRHHVSGFFTHREQAESALSRLIEQGLPRERLRIFANDPAASDTMPKDGSDAVLKDVLVDASIGTAVGTGIGALGSVALAAASVSLFVASPLVAPLMLLGWGASIGGLIGAAAGVTPGAGDKDGWLSDLIGDAIASGQAVMVAETRTAQETAIAREVIRASVGDSKDTDMA
ncbi:MAG TPA: hypothetical protein PLQ95_01300 [Thiobacillus sp.]|nr:hypothetical protein [Thiobacillus sp.]